MRCYHDDQIDANFVQTPCEVLVDLNEILEQTAFRCSANPGTDHFTIEHPSRDQQATVILLDATGREVWRELLRKEANIVHTSSLKFGLYDYRICTKDGGLLGHGRWMKE